MRTLIPTGVTSFPFKWTTPVLLKWEREEVSNSILKVDKTCFQMTKELTTILKSSNLHWPPILLSPCFKHNLCPTTKLLPTPSPTLTPCPPWKQKLYKKQCDTIKGSFFEVHTKRWNKHDLRTHNNRRKNTTHIGMLLFLTTSHNHGLTADR